MASLPHIFYNQSWGGKHYIRTAVKLVRLSVNAMTWSVGFYFSGMKTNHFHSQYMYTSTFLRENSIQDKSKQPDELFETRDVFLENWQSI